MRERIAIILSHTVGVTLNFDGSIDITSYKTLTQLLVSIKIDDQSIHSTCCFPLNLINVIFQYSLDLLSGMSDSY